MKNEENVALIMSLDDQEVDDLFDHLIESIIDQLIQGCDAGHACLDLTSF